MVDEMERADTAGVVALPGAEEFIANLHRARWAVVTSGGRSVALARLRSARLGLPPVLIGAEDVEHGKPSPEGYLKAAERIGADPANVAVIEDAPVGIQGALAAGAVCVALATTHPAEQLSMAEHIARDLRDLSWLPGDKSLQLLQRPSP